MINTLRNAALFFLRPFFPRLYFIEKKRLDLSILDCTVNNSKISAKAKLSAPGLIANCEIGDYTYISFNSILIGTKIGKFCSIGPNLVCGWGQHPVNGISTSPAFYSTRNQAGISFSETNKFQDNLPIEIGNDVFIGINVTILDGVKIGDGAVIGAGAVVSKDIPPYAIAVGSPIRIIRYRFSDDAIRELQKIKWWDFDESRLRDVEKLFLEVDTFIEKYRQDAP